MCIYSLEEKEPINKLVISDSKLKFEDNNVLQLIYFVTYSFGNGKRKSRVFKK